MWELMSLELDRGGKHIGKYFSEDLEMRIKRIDKKGFMKEVENEAKRLKCNKVRLEGPYYYRTRGAIHKTEVIAAAMESIVGEDDNKTLAMYGSGDMHHYTYGLCTAASRLSDKFCYIHFDQHSDFCKKTRSRDMYMGCGDFVWEIVELESSNASDIIMVGCKKWGMKCISSTKTRSRKKALPLLKSFLDDTLDDVYLSFDLDVMANGLVITDWGNGYLSKSLLLDMIAMIKEEKNIISADIVGYNPGGRRRKAVTLDELNRRIENSYGLYRDIAKVIVGEDWEKLKVCD